MYELNLNSSIVELIIGSAKEDDNYSNHKYMDCVWKSNTLQWYILALFIIKTKPKAIRNKISSGIPIIKILSEKL